MQVIQKKLVFVTAGHSVRLVRRKNELVNFIIAMKRDFEIEVATCISQREQFFHRLKNFQFLDQFSYKSYKNGLTPYEKSSMATLILTLQLSQRIHPPFCHGATFWHMILDALQYCCQRVMDKQFDCCCQGVMDKQFIHLPEDHFTRLPVRYHCGGWSEEVNSCILILSYMVYL